MRAPRSDFARGFAPQLQSVVAPIWPCLLDAGRDVWVPTSVLADAAPESSEPTLSEALRRWCERGWVERRVIGDAGGGWHAEWRLTIKGRIGVRKILGEDS